MYIKKQFSELISRSLRPLTLTVGFISSVLISWARWILDELNETIAYSSVPEPPPERIVAVGEDVPVISVATRGHNLQASAGYSLVVVPQPAPQVVPEDVRHIVSGSGRQPLVTDNTLQLVAQLFLQPGLNDLHLENIFAKYQI